MRLDDSRRRFVKRLGAVALLGSLAGCGDDGDETATETTEPPNPTSSTPGTTTAPETTTAPTETTEQTPTDTPTPTATPPQSPEGQADQFLSGVPNYDGDIVDETGNDEVTVAVGQNGLQFTPSAIRVNTGTTVTWEWFGPNHNVVAQEDAFPQSDVPPVVFDSGEPKSEGTFEFTFEQAGGYPYLCNPHSYQMKGFVIVE